MFLMFLHTSDSSLVVVGGVGGAAHLLELSLQLSDGVGFVRQQLL